MIEMEAQAMQAVICVAALLLLLVSFKATRLLPAHSEVQPNASEDEVPGKCPCLFLLSMVEFIASFV